MMKICEASQVYNQDLRGYKSCSKSFDLNTHILYNKDNQNLKGEITSLAKKRERYLLILY